MELTVSERFVLMGLLPGEGSYAMLKSLQQFREQIAFADEEVNEYGIQFGENSMVSWNPGASEKTKEIPVSERCEDIIVKALRRLNDSEKLKVEQMTLYKKIIGDK